MNEKSCKHWNGIINKKCGAGIDWKKTFDNATGCFGKTKSTCEKFELMTPEEIKHEEEVIDKHIEEVKEMFRSKKSYCCKADIDDSMVIKDGPYKGHGSRYCSKCKKHLYMV